MPQKKKLHYCNTIYGDGWIVDLNPLIVQAYPNKRILVLCARDGQEARLEKVTAENKNIHILGWWFMDPDPTLAQMFVKDYDIVVILSKDRIDRLFMPLLDAVETACRSC